MKTVFKIIFIITVFTLLGCKDQKEVEKPETITISNIDSIHTKIEKLKTSDIVTPYVRPESNEEEKKIKADIDEMAENLNQEKFSPEIISINADDFKDLTEGKDVQLIDVRTPEEYKDGHISNAKNVNVYDNDFKNQVSVLNKNQPVFVYCKSGGRSKDAAEILKKLTYKVYNLEDGILGWKEKSYVITK